MRIKDSQWSSRAKLFLKTESKIVEGEKGYSKIDGKWIPWDDGLIQLSDIIQNRILSGLNLPPSPHAKEEDESE